jgi:thiol-disulfide isomerase/thioredoxin
MCLDENNRSFKKKILTHKLKIVIALSLLIVYSLSLTVVIGAEKAHDFSLIDTEGQEVSLSNFRGKYVLLDFFAIWCKTCELSLPHLKNLNNQLGANISIISIDVDLKETEQQVKDYKEKHNMDWIVARDTEFVSKEYRVTALPTFVLIDPSGYIVSTYIGVTDESRILQDMQIEHVGTTEQIETTRSPEPSKLQDVLIYQTNWIIAILFTASLIIAASSIISRRRKRI